MKSHLGKQITDEESMPYVEGGVHPTLFCIFNHCYFIFSQNKLNICHTI